MESTVMHMSPMDSTLPTLTASRTEPTPSPFTLSDKELRFLELAADSIPHTGGESGLTEGDRHLIQSKLPGVDYQTVEQILDLSDGCCRGILPLAFLELILNTIEEPLQENIKEVKAIIEEKVPHFDWPEKDTPAEETPSWFDGCVWDVLLEKPKADVSSINQQMYQWALLARFLGKYTSSSINFVDMHLSNSEDGQQFAHYYNQVIDTGGILSAPFLESLVCPNSNPSQSKPTNKELFLSLMESWLSISDSILLKLETHLDGIFEIHKVPEQTAISGILLHGVQNSYLEKHYALPGPAFCARYAQIVCDNLANQQNLSLSECESFENFSRALEEKKVSRLTQSPVWFYPRCGGGCCIQ